MERERLDAAVELCMRRRQCKLEAVLAAIRHFRHLHLETGLPLQEPEKNRSNNNRSTTCVSP